MRGDRQPVYEFREQGLRTPATREDAKHKWTNLPSDYATQQEYDFYSHLFLGSKSPLLLSLASPPVDAFTGNPSPSLSRRSLSLLIAIPFSESEITCLKSSLNSRFLFPVPLSCFLPLSLLACLKEASPAGDCERRGREEE